MSKTLDVSIILPALLPNDDFLRCLYSIRAAFKDRISYEVVCVVRNIAEFKDFIASDIKFFREDFPSIYGAMNKGISEASGRYLYFIGQDDILLSSAVVAITQGKSSGADLILADVFWGDVIIFSNSPSPHSLVWRNWCHQGIFYDRLQFIASVREYPVKFKVQADHYANIIFSNISGLKTFKYSGCIAWYSAVGFSSREVDFEFRNAFPQIIFKYFGCIPFLLVVCRRLLLKVLKLIRIVK